MRSTDAQDLGDSNENLTTQDGDPLNSRSLTSVLTSFVGIPVVFGPLTHQSKVKSVIATLSVDGPKANLEKFTSFRTRCTYFPLSTFHPSILILGLQITGAM